MAEYFSITYQRQEEYRVEEDFRAQPINYNDGDFSVKTSYILSMYAPIMGEFTLTDDTMADLMAEAKQSLNVVLTSDNHRVSREKERIITLAAIELTKEFDEQAQKDSDDHGEKLWDHILSRLGFKNNQTNYNYLRRIIQRNVRFFATEGQKYYNTLNIQALSPSWSIKHLLNVLFSFYKNNLEYQYDPDVGTMQRFVKNIQKRWSDKSNGTAEDEKLRSDTLSSSFKTLFRCRPAYMAAVCDALLFRMDAQLSGNKVLDTSHNRWDQLLEDWFNEKSAEEKRTMHESRKRASNERVANSVQHIQPQYTLEGECICIRLPKIRLPEITERPIVELWQNGMKIAEERPKVFGNDLCLTTRAVQFLLSNEDVQWDRPFWFEVRLYSGGQIIYSSEKQLYREYLLFDSNGNEMENRAMTSRMTIVTSNKAKVEIIAPEDDYYERGTKGQVYDFPTDSAVTVNGKDIFGTSFAKQGIYCYMSEPDFPDLYVRCEEKRAIAYSGTPTLTISLNNQNKIRQYQIIEDDSTAVPMGEFGCTKDGIVKIALDRMPYWIHTIKVKDFSTGKIIYERDYCLLPDFSYSFDWPYYVNHLSSGMLSYCIGTYSHQEPFSLAVNQKEIEVELAEYPITCCVSVPRITVGIKGENGFQLPEHIWWEDIEQDVFLKVTAPSGVRITPVLGIHALPEVKNKNLYELGNFIHSRRWEEQVQTLGLLIRFEAEHDQMALTDVYFQETFLDTPIKFEEKRISWTPEDVFIGNRKSEFKITLENDEQDDPWEYTVYDEPQILEKKFPCGAGRYAYQVFLRGSQSLFSKKTEKLLYEGELEVIVPPEERYLNKELWLTRVSYWSAETEQMETSPIVSEGGVILDICYEGESESPNSGEMTAEYSGILYFRLPGGRLQDFNWEENDRFEKVNPVRFWVEDRYDLVIRTYYHEDCYEALLVDTRFTYRNPAVRIVNKKITPRDLLEKKKICSAETFEFEERVER